MVEVAVIQGYRDLMIRAVSWNSGGAVPPAGAQLAGGPGGPRPGAEAFENVQRSSELGTREDTARTAEEFSKLPGEAPGADLDRPGASPKGAGDERLQY